MPYYICPNCKERSIDIDRKEGLYDEAVACHHCGFGFLFELMDDYYPAPGTGFVVCDQEGRILAVGRGVFVDWFNRVWKRPPNLMAAELEQPQPDTAVVNRLSARMHAALDRFEALLAGRPYLYDEFGIADCIAFPFLKYAVFGVPAGDDELFHRILVEHQPLGGGYPRLKAWVARVDERPRA